MKTNDEARSPTLSLIRIDGLPVFRCPIAEIWDPEARLRAATYGQIGGIARDHAFYAFTWQLDEDTETIYAKVKLAGPDVEIGEFAISSTERNLGVIAAGMEGADLSAAAITALSRQTHTADVIILYSLMPSVGATRFDITAFLLDSMIGVLLEDLRHRDPEHDCLQIEPELLNAGVVLGAKRGVCMGDLGGGLKV